MRTEWKEKNLGKNLWSGYWQNNKKKAHKENGVISAVREFK